MAGERLAQVDRRQGQGHPAALRRRARQHRQARAGLPRGDDGASRHRGRQLEPVRRRRRRGRLQEGGVAAEQPTRTPDGSLGVDGIFCAERVVDVRRDARAPGERLGGQGEVRRLRRLAEPGEGPARRRARRPRSCRIPVQMGYLGVKTMVDAPEGRDRSSGAIDTGVHLATRDNMDQPEMKDAARAGSVAVAEVTRAAARAPRDARHRASAFGATVALDGVDLVGRRRRDLRPGRRERRRQEHADGDPRGRRAAGRGHDGHRRPALRAAKPDRGAPRRRRDDLPGAVARAAPVRHGEHPARRGADAVRLPAARPRWRDDRRRARWRELGHGDIRPDTPVGTLSVPVQQIVEIARAIAVGCRVLVLDEPTSSLGREDARRLFAMLAPAARPGPRDRLHLALHRRGERDRRSLRRAARRPERRRRRRPPTPRTTASWRMMIGGSRAGDCSRAAPRQRRRADPRRSTALQPGDATFTLHRGEVLGIAGLIGAGRTRLLRTLFGLEPVRSGRDHARRLQRRGARRTSAGSRAWACSARTARTRGSRRASASPTT